jgi:predicted ATP-grasp superfamily ATP-dependent carboligase
MRILVYEFVTGGGLAGRPVPRSLAREGLAMRTALVDDLAAIGCHTITLATDLRFTRAVPRGVALVPVIERAAVETGGRATIKTLVKATDAVWLIAPETEGCLERLAARIERSGKILLGPGAAAVRMAADKGRLPQRLARAGIVHPVTSVLRPGVNPRIAARRIGYPVVIKPARGAGCNGVRLVRHARDLRHALAEAERAGRTGHLRRPSVNSASTPLVMQRYIRGRAASVSMLADGRRAMALVVNGQRVTTAAGIRYQGGSTPLEHRFAAAAAEVAARTCAAIPGLRGYIGVDLVLTDSGPVVIEVNPRLTTAYLGVRAVLGENIAALALAACEGRLPPAVSPRQRARFNSGGGVVRE